MVLYENWRKVMKDTKGAWRKHPIFKEMDDAIGVVNWMRGKEGEKCKKCCMGKEKS